MKISKNNLIIVGNIYRPNTAPKAKILKFTEILENILKTIHNDSDLKHCQSIELLGDFNIDLLKFSIHGDTANYLDSILNYSLLPLITLPTRVINNPATLIDNILTTSKEDRYDTGILISDLSDHLPVFYIKHCEPYCPPQKNVYTRTINDKTIPKFQELLSLTSWQDVLLENGPEYAYKCFFDKIDDHINSAFPLKSVQNSYKNSPINPWFTSGLLVSRKTKKNSMFKNKKANPKKY